MKIIALSISLCVLSQAAVAQTPECKFMPNPTARLACYDKASAVEKSTLRTSASKSSKADPPKYVDAISAEDAQMNARLKNICRGC